MYDAWYNFWASVLNFIGAVLNVAISAINNFFQHAVDAIFEGVNAILGKVPDWIKDKLSLPSYVASPSVELISPIPVIVPPASPFAEGGVVTGPTRALIGEAGRAEMVMPLDNSPQMQQFISQIADAVRGNNAKPMEVHVYLDSKTVASTVYDELHNVEFRRGASLIS